MPTKTDGIFLGKFTVGGKTYEVLPEYYGDLPDEWNLRQKIRQARHIAINEANKLTKKNRKERVDLTRNPEELDEIIDNGGYTPALYSDGGGPIPRFDGTIAVIDGNNTAHRVRHTIKLSYRGTDVSVLYGVLQSVAATMRRYNATGVIVCWDNGWPDYRRELVPTYKEQRNHDDDPNWSDFIRQMQVLKQVLPSFGVLSVELPGSEADDLIYHATKMLDNDILKVVISTDADLLQCVNYDTIVYNPVKKVEIGLNNFQEFTGIEKKSYVLYRSMVGDGSDGIPGVKGIGSKTALHLLSAYGNTPIALLEAAEGNVPEGSKAMANGVAKKLRDHGLQNFMNVIGAIDLNNDLCGARYAVYRQFHDKWKPFDIEYVRPFLAKWAFSSLMKPEFLKLFRELRSPGKLFNPYLEQDHRFPKVIARRRPAK